MRQRLVRYRIPPSYTCVSYYILVCVLSHKIFCCILYASSTRINDCASPIKGRDTRPFRRPRISTNNPRMSAGWHEVKRTKLNKARSATGTDKDREATKYVPFSYTHDLSSFSLPSASIYLFHFPPSLLYSRISDTESRKRCHLVPLSRKNEFLSKMTRAQNLYNR